MNDSTIPRNNKNHDQEPECCDLYAEYCYPCNQDEAGSKTAPEIKRRKQEKRQT